MTVREVVAGALKPESICVMIECAEYEMINKDTGKIDARLLDMLGDFVVEGYKASKPDHYDVWVLMRPVKQGEQIA